MKLNKKSLILCTVLSAMLIPTTGATSALASRNTEIITESSIRAVPGIYKCIANNVNIRTGPGTTYDVVGTLNYGDIIYVSSISRGWAKFNNGGRLRYVKADYIEEART